MQNRLLNAIQQGRAPHAILISGPEGSGRRELARRCAARTPRSGSPTAQTITR